MTTKPQIEFATPEFSYDELEAQLKAYIEEAQCSPVLKEISKQVWLNSIGPAVDEFLERY